MLHGPLLGKILRYAIPFALSSILEQLFITIDVAVVGRFASSEALAPIRFLSTFSSTSSLAYLSVPMSCWPTSLARETHGAFVMP